MKQVGADHRTSLDYERLAKYLTLYIYMISLLFGSAGVTTNARGEHSYE